MNQPNNMPDWNAVMTAARGGFKSHKGSWLLVLIALAGWVVYSGSYTVPAESVGLIQRFGKYQTEVGPGLHVKIPFGVDKAINSDTTLVLSTDSDLFQLLKRIKAVAR